MWALYSLQVPDAWQNAVKGMGPEVELQVSWNSFECLATASTAQFQEPTSGTKCLHVPPETTACFTTPACFDALTPRELAEARQLE